MVNLPDVRHAKPEDAIQNRHFFHNLVKIYAPTNYDDRVHCEEALSVANPN